MGLKIKSINPKEMSLDDGSKWEFLDATPPPSTWQSGDEIDIKNVEGRFSSILRRVINKTQQNGNHEVPATRYMNEIRKGHLIDNERRENYPDEELDIDLRIVILYDDGSMLLENESVWTLTGLTIRDVSRWETGQYVRVSKGITSMKTYRIKNLSIDSPYFSAVFENPNDRIK